MVGGVVLTTMVKRELEDCEIGRQGDRGPWVHNGNNGNNQRERRGGTSVTENREFKQRGRQRNKSKTGKK